MQVILYVQPSVCCSVCCSKCCLSAILSGLDEVVWSYCCKQSLLFDTFYYSRQYCVRVLRVCVSPRMFVCALFVHARMCVYVRASLSVCM